MTYMAKMRFTYRNATEEELEQLLQKKFSGSIYAYVSVWKHDCLKN